MSPYRGFSQPQVPPTFSATLISLTNSEKTLLNQALNMDPSMYEVFSIDLNAMDDYVQNQTGAVNFVLNIRTGWSWSLSLEKDTAWASTLFADNIFEGMAGNIDTNRTTLHISETNLFGYVTNGSTRYRISSVDDLLGAGHSQHFIVYETQICTSNALASDIEINLELGLEADYDLFNKFQQQGYVDPASEISSRILAKMMVVQEFYHRFFPNLNFIYRGPYVRTTSIDGDYPNTADIMSRIRGAWNSKYGCIPVDAVMLFSGSNLDNNGRADFSDATSDRYSPAFRPVSYVDVSSSGLSALTGESDRVVMTAAHELAHIMAFMGHVNNNQSCSAESAACNTSPSNFNLIPILCEANTIQTICHWGLGNCVRDRMISRFTLSKEQYLTEIRPVPSLPCEASVSCIELSIETNNPFPLPPSNNCGNRDEMTYTITVCNPCEAQEIQVAFRQVISREEIVIMDENLDSMITLGSSLLHASDFFMLSQNECKQYHVTTRLKENALPNSGALAVVHLYTPASPAPNDVANSSAPFVVSGAFLSLNGGTEAEPKKITDFSTFTGNPTNAVITACGTPTVVKPFSFTGVIEIDLSHGFFGAEQQYCFDNATIRLNENTKILIKNGTLHISDSRIFGCSSLWNSIIVEPGATLILENTYIEDGEYAIQVKPGAHVEIKNCTFRDNYVAFYVADGGTALPQSIDLVQFHGNVIETQDALKAPRAGQKAYAGMLVNNATGIVVGNESEEVERNRFRNLYNGIVSFNSSVTVRNTAFSDIHPEEGVINPYHGYGIYAEAAPAKLWPWLMIKGFGQESDPAFDNCTVGIGLHSMRATVEQCRMSNTTLGIYSQESRFRKLTFTGNKIEALYYGIGLFQNTPTYIKVENNTIDIDDESGIGTGILVAENPNGLASHAANRIANNTINLKNGRAGILSYSGRYFEFYNNTINLQLDDKQSAIQVEGMADGLVRCNKVFGMGGTTLNTRGIVSKGAFSSIFSCNQLNDTKIGLSFDGMGDQSVVRGNEFSGQVVGLQIEMNGHIGAQNHKGNRWFGSFGEVGAKHLGTTLTSIEQSKFTVDADESLGQLFLYLPTFSALGSWFEDQDVANPATDIFYCTTTNNDACSNASPPVNIKDGIEGLDEKLARGSFNSPQFSTELTWTGRRHLYSRITENNISLQNHAQINSFYTNAANSVMEQLHESGQSIKEALTLSAGDLAALEGYADDIEDYLTDLGLNSEALSMDTSATGILSLLDDRADILADLATTIGAADTLSADLYDELLDDIATAQTVSNSVSATAVYEVNEKDYNNLLLISLEADTFTATQKSELWAIANQCPLEGGDGVYQARSLYALVNPLTVYNDVALCSGQQPLSRPNNEDSLETQAQFEVYPNPAKELASFRIHQNLDELITLEVYHASGRLLHKQNYEVSNRQFQIKTPWVSGIYFCRLSLNGQSLGTRMIAIIK